MTTDEPLVPSIAALPAPPAGFHGWPWTEQTPPALLANPPRGGWPKITVVCPTYQQVKYIEETLRSVLLQGYPALEFIVMDGASQDGTVALLEKYSPWIKHWESTQDHGQSHALNKGFDRATGELFGWINSDDYYLPGAFVAVARAFLNRPRGLYFGDWAERFGETPALTICHDRPAFAFEIAAGARHLQSHTVFWPRPAHQRFDESLKFTLDADFFKRLARSGLRPNYIAETIAVCRHHSASKTTTMKDIARTETAAWSQAQPWHTYWRWRAARWIDGLRRRVRHS